MAYAILKWVHVLSATILFGTGIGSAFYLFMANRTKDLAAICFATRHVVIADWLLTTPSVFIQFVTGLALLYVTGFTFSDRWVFWGVVLYFFAGACWIPVVWMQMRMRDMAASAMERKTSLPALYWVFDKWWIVAGSLAFPAVVIVFYLMIAKP